MQNFQILHFLSKINSSKNTIGTEGGLFLKLFFKTHNKNKPSRPRAQAFFPTLAYPLCFAQDHASVPLCCVAFLGCHIAAVLLQYLCSTDTTTATVLLQYWSSTDPQYWPSTGPVLTPVLAQYWPQYWYSTGPVLTLVLVQYWHQ